MREYYISKYPPIIYKVKTDSKITTKGAILLEVNGKTYYVYRPFWHETLEAAQEEIKEQLRRQKQELLNQLAELEKRIEEPLELSNDPLPIPQRNTNAK